MFVPTDFVLLVLSEAVLSPPRRTVLVLDGCFNCGDADRRSKRFAVTCGPMSRIATLDRFEYEYRDAEYEYGKKHEQSDAPKYPADGVLDSLPSSTASTPSADCSTR